MIFESNNTHIIYAYLTHDDLWDSITEDNCSKYDWLPNVSSQTKWLFYSHDEVELNGVLRVDLINTTHCVAHIHMQKKDRQYKEELGKEFYNYIFNNLNINKCFAHIPCYMDNIKKYLEFMGFEYEATLKDCWRKSAKLHNIDIYGINKTKALETGSA